MHWSYVLHRPRVAAKTTYDYFNHCSFPFGLFLVAAQKDGS